MPFKKVALARLVQWSVEANAARRQKKKKERKIPREVERVPAHCEFFRFVCLLSICRFQRTHSDPGRRRRRQRDAFEGRRR